LGNGGLERGRGLIPAGGAIVRIGERKPALGSVDRVVDSVGLLAMRHGNCQGGSENEQQSTSLHVHSK
jgi:hypothetical protein